MQLIEVTVTADASGDAVVASGAIQPGNGFLRRVEYVKDDYADTVDIDIVDGAGTVILSVDNQTASGAWHPRQATHSTAGVASLYAGSGEPVESDIPVIGYFQITVDEAGNGTSGTFRFWVA